jgi:hypothetical protein
MRADRCAGINPAARPSLRGHATIFAFTSPRNSPSVRARRSP